METLVRLAICYVAAVMLAPTTSAAPGAGKPNILYVLADDYGHNDIGYHGSEIATPALDSLAHAGVILDSFYTQPICSATRSSVMTGRYVHRLGFQHFNPPVGGGGVGALPLAEKTMAQFMKEAGYSTHHVGKWHLGATKLAYLPQNRGFDSSFGYYSGQMDYYDHVAQGFLDLHRAKAGAEQQCQPSYNGTYDLGMLVTEANSVLDSHPTGPAAPPLFMYFALHSVHAPEEVPPHWEAPYAKVPNSALTPRRTMCGMVACMDDGIGRLVAHWSTVRGEAWWNNTILFFHSDNGGPLYPGAANKNLPLRGGKLTLFDGGMRVNAFVYSAGLLPSAGGRVERGLVHITDLLPTFVTLGGGSLAGVAGGGLDGMDMWPTISGGGQHPSPRTEILHLIDPLGTATLPPVPKDVTNLTLHNSSAIRVGKWKLIVGMWALCSHYPHYPGLERQCGWWDPDSGTDDASDTFNDYINYEDNANLMGALPPRRVHAGPTCLSEPELCVVLFDMEAECVVPSLDKPRDKRIPLISPATFLEWIHCSPNEYNDISQQQPAVVAQLTARIEQLASGPDVHEPQWVPYKACDAPGGSCEQRPQLKNLAAEKKGCLDVYFESDVPQSKYE